MIDRVAVKIRGSVLIVSLVILLVLTVLGISGIDTTLLQERMAGNMQESATAFQAAEAGLRYGEADVLLNNHTVFNRSCTNGLCEPADPALDSYDVWVTSVSSPVYWDSVSASGDRNTREYKSVTFGSLSIGALQNVSRQPAYIIEKLNVVDRKGSLVVGSYGSSSAEWYRITSRGFGRNGQSASTVQSVFRK